MGTTPWVRLATLAEAIRHLGFDVDVDDPGHDAPLLGRPPLFMPRPGRLAAARDTATYARDWVRWRRGARRALVARGVERVLVWEASLALLYRFVRPRGVRISWVLPELRYHNRLGRLRWLLTLSVVDTIVMRRRGETRFFRSRQVLARPPVAVSRGAQAPGTRWVVLARAQYPTKDATDYLRSLARAVPATAMVFAGRRGDAPPLEVIEYLRDAAAARAVVYAMDDEWLAPLHVSRAIDVGPEFGDDHRHWSLLNAGAAVAVSADVGWWTIDSRLTRRAEHDGTNSIEIAPGAAGTTLEEWCRLAVGGPAVAK